jgi:hypothetical protein
MGNKYIEITDADERDREDWYKRDAKLPGSISIEDIIPNLKNEEFLKYKAELDRQLKEKKIKVEGEDARLLQQVPETGK